MINKSNFPLPQEYVRVSRKEVDELAFKLQKLKASVKSLEKSKAEVPETVRKMINSTRPRNQNRVKPSQPELVNSFKEKLNNGRLRTDIEREKSVCTAALKSALPSKFSPLIYLKYVPVHTFIISRREKLKCVY